VLSTGLEGCAFLLPVLLCLAPLGAAPLAVVAGLLAAALIAAQSPFRTSALRPPLAILLVLVLWGALSASWSIDPARTLGLAARLTGLVVAALALTASAGRLTTPWRLCLCLLAGTGVAIAAAGYDLGSGGGLARIVSTRPFIAPRLNQTAVWLALMMLPIAALLSCRGMRWVGVMSGAAMAAMVMLLDGSTAKIALGLSLPVAALVYLRRRAVARAAAVLSVIAITTAPLSLPQLARSGEIFAAVDGFKESAGHRLLIWSFTGDRIAERPYLGWGLDAARAIPGGADEIRPGEKWLPLHPHNAALQVWLELGAPGAALFALLVGWLWLRLADAPWPRLYAAAAAGGLTAALTVTAAGWGIWQEWWIGTLALALFAALAMARAAEPVVAIPPPPGSPGAGR
jgi:O-antigen ligase